MVIDDYIRRYKSEGKKIFASSSFQTQSMPMLHLLSLADRSIPIYFLNTGFHFPETLNFKNDVAERFNLNVIEVSSMVPKIQQRDEKGRLLFTSDPDHCCYLNKVQPLEPVMQQYDVWISGVRADQSHTRSLMSMEQDAEYGVLRYHPMLWWTNEMVYQYIVEHDLPRHPLEKSGFFSIGCQPCTIRPGAGGHDTRDARWFGMNKTECGIHTELIRN